MVVRETLQPSESSMHQSLGEHFSIAPAICASDRAIRGLLRRIIAVCGLLLLVPMALAADHRNPVSLVLMSPLAGHSDPQLAISWKGADSALREVSAVDASGNERVLKAGTRIEPGVDVEPVALAAGDVSLVVRMQDIDGRNIAEARIPAAASEWAGAPAGAITDWKATFAANGGPDGEVRAALTWDDGSGDALYVAGYFVSAGGVLVNNIARWNGSSWSPLAGGVDGLVKTLVAYDGALVAAGNFSSVDGQPIRGIARWDGASWAAIGPDIGADVNVLAVYQGQLIAGGYFSNIDGEDEYIARWNGSAWLGFGGAMNQAVDSLLVFNGDLVAGGNFFSAGDIPASGIARWNGQVWAPFGSGSGQPTAALTIYNGELVAAGGNFSTVVKRWNGSSWTPLGAAMSSKINALHVYQGELIAVGRFTHANGGVPTARIARWNGSSWVHWATEPMPKYAR